MIKDCVVSDAGAIHELVNKYASDGVMLAVSLSEIYEKLYEFSVYVNESNEIVGVIALHPMWEDIAEVRSFAVKKGYEGQGIGRKLLEYKLEKAKSYEFKSIFALTYRVDFFTNNNFHVTDIESLPRKIWTDCLKCPKYPNCDETAVIINI